MPTIRIDATSMPHVPCIRHVTVSLLG